MLVRKKFATVYSLCWVLVFGLSDGGCTTSKLQSPTAAITGMDVGDVNGAGFTMNFDVDLTNPNAVPLPVSAANYKLGFAGVDIAKGKAKSEGAIPAGGTKNITVPVTLKYRSLLAIKNSVLRNYGNVPYKLDGDLALSSGKFLERPMHVPLKYDGVLALRELLKPQILLQSSSARKLARELLGSVLSD